VPLIVAGIRISAVTWRICASAATATHRASDRRRSSLRAAGPDGSPPADRSRLERGHGVERHQRTRLDRT
jgi:hypothetical protein